MSEGFVQAGCQPLAHVEQVKDACETIKTREGYYYHLKNNSTEIYYSYLKGRITKEDFYSTFSNETGGEVINLEISKQNRKKIFKVIDNALGGENVDLLIGGPPCQAFSVIGRSRVGKINILDDPRLELYKQYVKHLRRYKPKAFIFENVRGLLSLQKGRFHQEIVRSLQSEGYAIKTYELNAKDFGVLQDRKRIIIMGFSEKYGDDIFDKLDLYENTIERVNVSKLLNDLPPLDPGEKPNITKYKSYYVPKYLEESGIRNGVAFTTLHHARPHNRQDLEIYSRVIEQWNDTNTRLKYSSLPERLITHKNTTAFLDRFKIVAGNMNYSQTIVAHICKDGHYFIHPDINQVRSISVREAARLQSFPDNFYFEGSRTSRFKQIGNAVPPLMAKCIALAVKKIL